MTVASLSMSTVRILADEVNSVKSTTNTYASFTDTMSYIVQDCFPSNKIC